MTPRMSIRRRALLPMFVLAGAASVGLSAMVADAAQINATGRVRIVKPLATTFSPIAFGRLVAAPAGTATIAPTLPAARSADGVTLLPNSSFSPGVIVLTGEPGLAYRVVLPASVSATPDGYLVNGFKMSTANNPAITMGSVRVGQLDAQGRDTIWIGATINLPKKAKNDTYAASVPVVLTYE